MKLSDSLFVEVRLFLLFDWSHKKCKNRNDSINGVDMKMIYCLAFGIKAKHKTRFMVLNWIFSHFFCWFRFLLCDIFCVDSYVTVTVKLTEPHYINISISIINLFSILFSFYYFLFFTDIFLLSKVRTPEHALKQWDPSYKTQAKFNYDAD